jgi:hypothetical protein
MRAVNVGVRHDDTALIGQLRDVEFPARAAPQRPDQIGNFFVLADLFGRGGGRIQDLASQWKDRLREVGANWASRMMSYVVPATRIVAPESVSS